MDANFFYYSIYDIFIQRQPRALVHPYTVSLKRTSPQKLLTGFLPNFTGMFLRVKKFSSPYRKTRPVERYRCLSASSCLITFGFVSLDSEIKHFPVYSRMFFKSYIDDQKHQIMIFFFPI